MIRRRDADARGGSVFVCVRVPHHLDQALQRELTALATFEAAHRSACSWLDEWSGPQAVKEHVASRREARHQTEREAHVLRLADLHQQRMVLALSDETGGRADEVSSSPGMGQGGSTLPKLRLPVWMISSADHGRAGRTSDKG